uniref:Uncharacterized protein n=1 Tax=Anopheles albimanus TaxID=7167 RepID=A0A182FPT3_ANOAL
MDSELYNDACLGIHRETVKELRRIAQLLWLCKSCSEERLAGGPSLGAIKGDDANMLRNLISSEISKG